jgi:hypothetical protein
MQCYTSISKNIFCCGTATTKVAIQLWDFVDTGKHLDWDGKTKYYIRWDNSIAR